MIRWLVQSTSVHSALMKGEAPAGLLSAWELEQLAALTHFKRRQDWLLGRWTAKRLLQEAVKEVFGLPPPLEALVIRNDTQGVPLPTLNLGPVRWDLPIALSISHCDGHAFCALNFKGAIGADIEQVECRGGSFAGEYFTEAEIAVLEKAPPRPRDLLVTAIWSAKEAALKAAHLGLSVDTHAVTCRIDPSRFELSWMPFSIEWNLQPRMINSHSMQVLPGKQPAIKSLPELKGYWRVFDRFVITLAIAR